MTNPDAIAQAWSCCDKAMRWTLRREQAPLCDAVVETEEVLGEEMAAVREAMLAVADEGVPPSVRGMLHFENWRQGLRAQIEALGREA